MPSIRFSWTIICLLLLTPGLFPTPSLAEDEVQDPEAAVIGTIETLLANLKTATWDHDVWLTDGNKEHRTVANVWWTAGTPIRVDIIDGDEKNSTAVLTGDTVRGFRRGMLSFARLSFDVNHRRVLSIRGQNMKSTGFIHHLHRIIQQEDTRTLSIDGADAIINYRNEHDLPTRMWVRLPDLHPYRIEVREEGEVVERHQYRNIKYHVDIDPDLFDI